MSRSCAGFSIVVVNRTTLSVPVEEVVADIERDAAIFAGLEGFVGQTLVKTGPQELVVGGRWASPGTSAEPFDTGCAPVASALIKTSGTARGRKATDPAPRAR